MSKNIIEVNERLINAVEKGSLEEVKNLIENEGAQIEYREHEALVQASTRGFMDKLRYLIKKGSDVAAQNQSALTLAACNNQLVVVQYLLEDTQFAGKLYINAYNNILIRFVAKDENLIGITQYLIMNGASLDEAKKVANPITAHWLNLYELNQKLEQNLPNKSIKTIKLKI